jgi:hypothetical protein
MCLSLCRYVPVPARRDRLSCILALKRLPAGRRWTLAIMVRTSQLAGFFPEVAGIS